jgi:NAD(P)H dehydrogenase (quinone)
MSVKIAIVFHSLHGHVHKLAQEIAKGASSVDNTNVDIFRVPELLNAETVAAFGAAEAQAALAEVPIIKAEDLAQYDAIFFGCGVRYGGATASLRSFMETTGGLWYSGGLINKIGSVFGAASTPHGGIETLALELYTYLAAQGLIIVPAPYSAEVRGQELVGGGPLASGVYARREMTENEKKHAFLHGEKVAKLAVQLKKGAQ